MAELKAVAMMVAILTAGALHSIAASSAAKSSTLRAQLSTSAATLAQSEYSAIQSARWGCRHHQCCWWRPSHHNNSYQLAQWCYYASLWLPGGFSAGVGAISLSRIDKTSIPALACRGARRPVSLSLVAPARMRVHDEMDIAIGPCGGVAGTCAMAPPTWAMKNLAFG
jgi:hypothetical protein